MRLPRFRASGLALALAGLFSLSTVLPGQAASTTVVVTPSNPQGWTAFQDNGPPSDGTFAFVSGPASPPAGSGSARLTTDSTHDGVVLAAVTHAGTPLSQISRLEYSTYRAAGDPALAIALQFDIDFDSTDANTAFQGRLVYEPYYGQTVQTGQWQTWNTLTGSAAPSTATGNWWFTRAPGNAVCSIGNPCTWAEVRAAYPNAAILGRTILKAGSGWASFDGNVDKLVIGVGSNETIYDFELTPPDTTPPDTAITSNPPAQTSSTSATFQFTSTETGSTFECKLDGGAFASCTSPQNYSGLGAGPHTFQVRAIDGAGNVDPSPASYSWTIFTVAADKDQCKGNGWQSIKRADGSSFKNQGDCVSYTNTGR